MPGCKRCNDRKWICDTEGTHLMCPDCNPDFKPQEAQGLRERLEKFEDVDYPTGIITTDTLKRLVYEDHGIDAAAEVTIPTLWFKMEDGRWQPMRPAQEAPAPVEVWQCNGCGGICTTQTSPLSEPMAGCLLGKVEATNWHRIAAPEPEAPCTCPEFCEKHTQFGEQEAPTQAGSPIWPDDEREGEDAMGHCDSCERDTEMHHACATCGKVLTEDTQGCMLPNFVPKDRSAEIARLRLLCEKGALECSAAQDRMVQAEAEVKRLESHEEADAETNNRLRQRAEQAEADRDLHAADNAALRARVERLVQGRGAQGLRDADRAGWDRRGQKVLEMIAPLGAPKCVASHIRNQSYQPPADSVEDEG